nr:unnamed protein product [Haemonchus contortus]
MPFQVFNGKYFEVDPCRLPHVCIPWKSAQDQVTRMVYVKVCALGLKAIVADGVHDLQPDSTNKTVQLYVIHGVTDNGVDIPMLPSRPGRMKGHTSVSPGR